MTMETFKDIIRDGGYLNKEELKDLAFIAPNLLVAAKMGMSARFSIRAAEMAERIAKLEAGGDYVREVFIPCSTWDKIKEVFGWIEFYSTKA